MKTRDVFGMVLAMLASACAASANDAVVMTVDGEPVTVSEYQLVMEGKTGEVFNYFYGTEGLEDRHGYWRDDAREKNPIKRLRSAVTDEMKRIKTIQRLAKEKGVVADISFAAFQAGLARENERRQTVVENKGVIYGPRRYQPYRYYFFRLKDHEQATLEAFQKDPENAVPEKEIADFHAENAPHFEGRTLSETRDQIARILQRNKFRALVAKRIEQAKVEINAEVLNAISPRNDT